PALDDTAFAVWLSRVVGVTPVPGSSFYREGGGRTLVRFVFCKTEEILVEAARRLRGLSEATTATPRPAEPAVESGLQRWLPDRGRLSSRAPPAGVVGGSPRH